MIMKKIREVAIVHFNTPELTEAAILSLRKHGGKDYHVTVFDNSDSRPFTKKMDNVTIIDNTENQVIDLDAELRKYPNRSRQMGCAHGGDFGSVRHMMSVQKLWDLIPEGFLLMDSDILIKKDIDFMFMQDRCVCGHIQKWEITDNKAHVDRLVPFLLWINVPLCKERGATFFDPDRAFALQAGGKEVKGNWYDTGAALLEDIRSHKNGLNGICIDIRPLMVHYQAGSWRRTSSADQKKWLENNMNLWLPYDGYKLGDTELKKPENKNAKIFICAHKDFVPVVKSNLYQVVLPKGKDEKDNVVGSFWSELLQMDIIAQRKTLPKYIGFCGYRKYFAWLDNAPDIQRLIERHGCAVSLGIDLGMSVKEQYDKIVGNIEDLDIATQIIEKEHKTFAPYWKKALESNVLHPASMFIMDKKDFLAMIKIVLSVVGEYLKIIDYKIDERILTNPEKYHIPGSTLEYQRRVGGQLCERIISAWIDWKYPNAKEIPVKITSKPIAR